MANYKKKIPRTLCSLEISGVIRVRHVYDLLKDLKVLDFCRCYKDFATFVSDQMLRNDENRLWALRGVKKIGLPRSLDVLSREVLSEIPRKITALFLKVMIWVGVSNIFYFHPYLGKIPILTSIFFRGVETTKQWCFYGLNRDPTLGSCFFWRIFPRNQVPELSKKAADVNVRWKACVFAVFHSWHLPVQ